MEHIALITGGTFPLPYEDPYKKHILLFGYSKNKKSVMIKITNHQSHILVLPNQQDIQTYGNENYLTYVKNQINENFKTKITNITIVEKMPTLGFSGERKDLLLKFFYANENDKFNIQKYIQDIKMLGSIHLDLIVHSKISTFTQFLHEKKLKLQSWITVSNFHRLSNNISDCKINLDINSFLNQIAPCTDLEQLKQQIQPNIIFIRLYAISSLATRNNFCVPNATLKDDCITHLAYQINQEPKCLCLTDFENDELQLLNTFSEILHSNSISVIVFASDELVKPNAMEYITTRAQLLNSTFSFSPIKYFKVYANELPNKTNDLIHPGIERIDLIKVLKRAMVNPPMVGFTLLDCIRHQNLMSRNKSNRFDNEMFNLFASPNYIPPNHFNANTTEIQTYLLANISILVLLMKEKGFWANCSTISRENDLDIKKVVERGQQKRVFGNIMYDFDENDLYLDEQNLTKNPLTVARLRADSSYPDPPWKENPNIEDFIPIEERKKTRASFFGASSSKKNQLLLNPKKKKKETTKGYGGGLVLDPLPGLYKHPRHTVPTNDWASMYPNLIIAYYLCIMREIRDSKWLTDPDVELEYIPRNDYKCDVLVKKYKGKQITTFTPRVIKRFLELRETARTQGKEAKTLEEKIAFKMTENALKASANSVYGFFGCLTSDIVSIQFASTVTQLGQFMQKTVRYQILLAGGAVVYGDTDSCFTMYPVDPTLKDPVEIRKKIKEKAEEITRLCSKIFHPSKIIVENLKSPLLLTNKKKTYISIEDGGKIAPKGLGLLKRDKCQKAREIALVLAEQLIKGTLKSNIQICLWLDSELSKLPMGYIVDSMQLAPFVLSAELGSEYKGDDKLSLELACLYEKESGQRPNVGDRMSFVVAFFDDNRLHNKRVVPPYTFLKNNYVLDIKHYIEKQIYSCLKQILCLDIHQDLLLAIKKRCDLHILKWDALSRKPNPSLLFKNKKFKLS